MENWVVAAKRADFSEIADKFGIDPVVARLIRNRDVVGDAAIGEYLYGTIRDLHSPHLLRGCDEAVGLLRARIRDKKKIRVIGDYDIDGVNATYILCQGLRHLGADVDYDLPDRIRDGYGLNAHLVDAAHEAGVDTIVTCDNGISAVSQVAYARSLGMTVIVTDHHEPGPSLPDADVVVNPRQPGCPYPYKHLCGAAVAYKLMVALYEAEGRPDAESDVFLEYAGFATVGDVMELTGENRILVKEALKRLERTENLGYRALIRAAGLLGKPIRAYHVGFVLGPCLNAGGRLDTAKKSLRLLLSESDAEAGALAEELVELNRRRKELTERGYAQAVDLVERGGQKEDRVLVVYLPDCHESLAGIIAGRLREHYYRPVFVLTRGASAVKGSGRSNAAYSMFAEMQKCADLFLNFGGHPMAAGCTLEESNIGPMRERLNAQARLTEADLTPKVLIDVAMPIDYISEEFIRQLDVLEPYGKGNPKPVFAQKNLRVLTIKEAGDAGRVVRLRLKSEAGTVMDAVYFGDAAAFRAYLERTFGEEQVGRAYQGRKSEVTLSVTYYPTVQEYRQMRSLQVVVQHYR